MRPTRDQLKAAAAGALVAVVLIALLGLGVVARIVWVRSYNGQWAYEYIQAFIQQQQQQQKAQPPPPAPASK